MYEKYLMFNKYVILKYKSMLYICVSNKLAVAIKLSNLKELFFWFDFKRKIIAKYQIPVESSNNNNFFCYS